MPTNLRTLATIVCLAAAASGTRAQPAADPLRLTLACERATDGKLRFTLHNVSTTPSAAVIGFILANDKLYFPAPLRLTVRRNGVPNTEFEYTDPSQPAVIAGRVDPWLVALPAGASYSVFLPGYFGPSPTSIRELFSSPADVQLHLTTQKIGTLGSPDLRLIHIWVGALTSDWIRLPDACPR